jgi:hypothetical protein
MLAASDVIKQFTLTGVPEALLLKKPTSFDLNAELRKARTKTGLFQIREVLNESPQILRVQDNTTPHFVWAVLMIVAAFIQKE